MGKTFDRTIRSIGISATIFAVAFLAAFVSSSLCARVSDSDARTVATVVDNSGYYVSIESDDIAMNLIATPTGAATVASDTIVTKTNSPTGHKLYISVANSQTNGNRLYKDGDRASGMYLSPSAGTLSTPVPLAVNTWGYTTESGADEESDFIGVPLRGSENLLQSTSTPNTTGVELDITYGAKANMALESGIYSNEIAYTAIAEGEAAAEGTLSVFPNTSLVSGGGTLTIATDLYTNMEDIGTIDVSLTDGTSTYTCANPEKLNRESGSISITCTIPTVTTTGTYDVTLSLPKFGKNYEAEDAIEFTEIPLIDQCNTAAVDTTFTFSGVEYIKLADNNCYTHSSQGTSTWANAYTLCPAGTTVPSYDGFMALRSIYSGRVHEDIGWDNIYWTSTKDPNNTNRAKFMTAVSNSIGSGQSLLTVARDVLCVAATPKGITDMQQMNPNICAAMAIGDTKTLTDVRNAGTYSVAKLADNRCWMTQNLRLIGPLELTPNTSDVTNTFTLTASDSSQWCKEDSSTCIDQSMVIDSDNGAYGTYYNWYAATAGTGTRDLVSAEAPDSICPKGWRLPTGSASGEFGTLYNEYPSVSAMLNGPMGFTLSGYRSGNEFSGIMSGSANWSSTGYYLTQYAYNIDINLTGTVSQGGASKFNGLTIRCIADN
ncbi:hypothetical protein IKW75_00755 [Candidatus Saccharibacteria bacterium]|nr:hypothetical protein [Candidatus Saccharibacteria bacterium]